jgi:hypothetical protein
MQELRQPVQELLLALALQLQKWYEFDRRWYIRIFGQTHLEQRPSQRSGRSCWE